MMPRFMAAAIVALVADAIALFVTSLLLERMSLSVVGLIFAVLLFTAVDALFEPFVRSATASRAPKLEGLSALVATLVSLIIVTVFSRGLQISGALTWLLATMMVWLIGLLARRLLPRVVFTDVLRTPDPS